MMKQAIPLLMLVTGLAVAQVPDTASNPRRGGPAAVAAPARGELIFKAALAASTAPPAK
jgi:hypothetical protein